MRIAVSGTHATGKSTLIAELAGDLPAYERVEEAYHALADEGHAFSAPPSAEDFAQCLERSLRDLRERTAADALFDRCPVDWLAYLAAIGAPVRDWIPTVAEAVSRLDLIVFVPIERPDVVDVQAEEGPGLRRRVDRLLREMLLDDGWGLAPRVLRVDGSPRQRGQQVVRMLQRTQGRGEMWVDPRR